MPKVGGVNGWSKFVVPLRNMSTLVCPECSPKEYHSSSFLIRMCMFFKDEVSSIVQKCLTNNRVTTHTARSSTMMTKTTYSFFHSCCDGVRKMMVRLRIALHVWNSVCGRLTQDAASCTPALTRDGWLTRAEPLTLTELCAVALRLQDKRPDDALIDTVRKVSPGTTKKLRLVDATLVHLGTLGESRDAVARQGKRKTNIGWCISLNVMVVSDGCGTLPGTKHFKTTFQRDVKPVQVVVPVTRTGTREEPLLAGIVQRGVCRT